MNGWNGRPTWVAAALALVACHGDRDDRTAAPLATPATTTPAHATAVEASIALGAIPVSIDERGVPRLLRGAGIAAAPAASAAASARALVDRLAPAWGVRAGQVPALDTIGVVPVRGGEIVRIAQVIDGLPVVGGELRVLVAAGGRLVAASGTLRGLDTPRSAPRFTGDDAGAVSRAIRHAYGAAFDAGDLAVRERRPDGTRMLAGASGAVDVELARARQVWYPQGGALVAAWLVESYASDGSTPDGDAFRTVLAADDGRVLEHRSLVADAAFGYRVFAETTGDFQPMDGPLVDFSPHPSGAPDGSFPAYTTPNLVTVDSLNDLGDPWLPGGATETIGNNVEAYVDFNAPTGLTFGDFRATATAPGVFDRTYDTAQGPMATQAQQMAAVTSLFYAINWLHDFWYDAGFTEAAGNAQNLNYGRGGEDRDAILAEAQDNALGGSRNNANMSTPADGFPPRMQVFLWSGKDDRTLSVSGRSPAVGAAAFGPQNFDLTGDVVLYQDGAGGSPTDGCEVPTNDLTGMIVLVDRGACSFKSKALRIQQAGGVGMILANHLAGTIPPGMGNDATITDEITIPSLSITLDEGNTIKAELGAGTVSATMHRLVGVELDGSLDSTLVAHEYGHYLHHRLSLCGTALCGAMSEGWGDFLSLLQLAREGDNLASGAYPFSIYTTQSFAGDPGYFGIRRAPYSASFAVNALTFGHMADGATMPTHPFKILGPNSEVHNAGEVWAAALWEGYVALQQAGTSFAEVHQAMAEYVVAGLLLMAPDVTPTEARDAILAAAWAASPADHDVLVAAFARRGFGSCAVSPPRASVDFTGIVESFEVRGRALTGLVDFGDSVTTCDSDGVLDGEEAGRLHVPITNPGHVAVTDVTVTLTSTTTGVTVTSGPVTIASLPPYTTTEATFDVALDAAAVGPLAGDFTIEVAATGACAATVSTPFAVRLNVDDVPASSATDAFDAGSSVWTPAGDALPAWSHVTETALDRQWHGADLAMLSDTSLVSPALTADATAPVVVTFTHRFQFEYTPGTPATVWDGGVIEVSTDDGATWQDVTTYGITPGYGGVAITGQSSNPLAGRDAFSNTNPSHPATDTVTLDFGTALAGETFRLRFRIGTDVSAGAAGWEIDDVAFSGIVGTPFPTQEGDVGTCVVNPPDAGPPDAEPATPDAEPEAPDAEPAPDAGEPGGEDGDGGCCSAGGLGTGNAGLALGVLAVLAGRRRRRRG